MLNMGLYNKLDPLQQHELRYYFTSTPFRVLVRAHIEMYAMTLTNLDPAEPQLLQQAYIITRNMLDSWRQIDSMIQQFDQELQEERENRLDTEDTQNVN